VARLLRKLQGIFRISLTKVLNNVKNIC
jgi:hypothetical protein